MFALLWLAPPVAAQEEGVYVDPGSPTGKEYAIPFDSARRQADPSGGGAGVAPGAAPLFGVGIVASSGTSKSEGGSTREQAPTGRAGAAATAARSRAILPPRSRPRRR